MICLDCKNRYHELCRGGTWCDCQHRVASNRWGQWLERARTPHETLPPLLIAVPEGREPGEFAAEINAAMELTRMAQEDGLGDYGPAL